MFKKLSAGGTDAVWLVDEEVVVTKSLVVVVVVIP